MLKFSYFIILSSLAISACAPQFGPSRTASKSPEILTEAKKVSVEDVLLKDSSTNNRLPKIHNTLYSRQETKSGVLDSAILDAMTKEDLRYYNSITQKALEVTGVGVTSRWVSPDTGHGGSITPVKSYQTSSGRYCREFTQTVNIGVEKSNAMGTACRKPGAVWEIIN